MQSAPVNQTSIAPFGNIAAAHAMSSVANPFLGFGIIALAKRLAQEATATVERPSFGR